MYSSYYPYTLYYVLECPVVGNHWDVIAPEVETADNNMISFRRTFVNIIVRKTSVLLSAEYLYIRNVVIFVKNFKINYFPISPCAHCISHSLSTPTKVYYILCSPSGVGIDPRRSWIILLKFVWVYVWSSLTFKLFNGKKKLIIIPPAECEPYIANKISYNNTNKQY